MKTLLATLALLAGILQGYSSQPKIIEVGGIEGKFYFVDPTARNWTASKDYCESFGMRLASVETNVQKDYLKSQANSTFFTGGYWCAGRDSHTPSQLHWHYGSESVDSSVIGNWSIQTVHFLSCLEFCPDCNNDFFLLPCEAVRYVMCENDMKIA